MSILSILEFPDPRLRTVAEPVDNVDKSIKQLVADMFETMYIAQGVGLAATQVNIHKQIIVIDTSEEKNNPQCFINPRIIELEGVEVSDEGCLSVPSIFESIERAKKIRVQALDSTGVLFELEAEGLLAVCIQHEMDHLKGVLFVDYLSSLKVQRIKKKLLKMHKREK